MKRYFYCDTCNRMSSIDVESSYVVPESEDMYTIVRYPVEIIAFCKECKEEMFPIDNGMASIIERLNNCGIKTLFCCEGHMDILDRENNNCIISTPYILLEHNDTIKNIVYKLKGEEKYKDITTIEDEACSYINGDNEPDGIYKRLNVSIDFDDVVNEKNIYRMEYLFNIKTETFMKFFEEVLDRLKK